MNTVSADQSLIYVNGSSGNDSNDGFSWTTAKLSIKNATGTVASGGTVNIANGNYNGVNNNIITIDKSMTIIGQSKENTIINGSNGVRIFIIQNGLNVIIQNLTLANGYSTGGSAILNSGNLVVNNTVIKGNTANNPSNPAMGGAIQNMGHLNVIGSDFINNTAISNMFSQGGAIYNYGILIIGSNSTFKNNTATVGGAIFNSYSNLSSVIISDSFFTSNTAPNNSGGAIYNGRDLTVIRSKFTDNTAPDGGAIWNEGNLNVIDSYFNNNTADFGGAISNHGNLNVTGSIFTGNNATNGNSISISNGWEIDANAQINFNYILNNIGSFDIYCDTGTVDANLNWWGSNTGPTIGRLYNVAAPLWLVFNLTASPSTIPSLGTSAITADLTHDNLGNYHDPANRHVPDGSILFTTTSGNINPNPAFLLEGIAQAFLKDVVSGSANVTAKFDNQSITRLINVLNVPVFNGNTSESFNTIQAAINDPDTLNGHIIIVAAGTYIENILLNKRLSIISSGIAIIQASNHNNPAFTITSAGNGTTIEGFLLSGEIYLDGASNCNIIGNNLTNTTRGIFLNGSNNNTIKCNIISDNEHGIIIISGNGNIISENSIKNNDYGINIIGSNNIIQENTIIANKYYGICLFEGSNSNLILENVVTNNIWDGIVFYGSNSNMIQNNTIKNNQYGILLADSSNNNTISENNVTNNTFDGISVYSSNDNVIQNNNISSNNNSGIYLDNCIRTIIAENTIDGQLTSSKSNWGICLINSNGNNAIINNTVMNFEEGINLYNVNGVIIKGNTVKNNHWDNVALNLSLFNIISENTIKNADSGIRLIGESNNNTISNNNLTGNIWTSISLVDSLFNQISLNILNDNQEGMYLYASNNNTVLGNTANNNIWDGIALHDSSNNFIYQNTEITDNNCGLRIIGTSKDNEVFSNIISSNLWSNISLETASNNLIHNNTLNNANVGLYLQNSSNNDIYNNIIQNNAWDGIDLLYNSNTNAIHNNNISGNYYGERILNSVGNTSYENNFVNNTVQAYDNSTNSWINHWDISTVGNYWSDWSSTDPRSIDGGSSKDYCPNTTQF
ncbi:MAG: NosD domain-containing protein [Methanobacterium sp.]